MQAIGKAAGKPDAKLQLTYHSYSKSDPPTPGLQGDAAWNGSGIRLVGDGPVRVVAHEIGHVLSFCNFVDVDNEWFVQGAGHSRFEPSAVASELVAGFAFIDDETSRSIRQFTNDKGWSGKRINSHYMNSYTQKDYSNGTTEVPSTLLDYFYHNPVEFTRLMPKSMTKAVLGLLEGSWR